MTDHTGVGLDGHTTRWRPVAACFGIALLLCLVCVVAVQRDDESLTPIREKDAGARAKPPQGSSAVSIDTPQLVRQSPWDTDPSSGVAAAAPSSESPELGIGELDGGDARRLLRVNAALSAAGIRPIPDHAKIKTADLEVLRAIVDEAESRVSKAEDDYLDAATAATKPLRLDLMDRLARKETNGLPLLSKDNNVRRTHPHEAITQVSHEGKLYVLRVGPWQDQNLAKTGAAHEVAEERRVREYTSMVVPMFR